MEGCLNLEVGLSVEGCRDESSEKCGDVRAFGMGRSLNIQSDGLNILTVLDYEGSLCARDTLRPGTSFLLSFHATPVVEVLLLSSFCR